jgi:hypothetical protein
LTLGRGPTVYQKGVLLDGFSRLAARQVRQSAAHKRFQPVSLFGRGDFPGEIPARSLNRHFTYRSMVPHFHE